MQMCCWHVRTYVPEKIAYTHACAKYNVHSKRTHMSVYLCAVYEFLMHHLFFLHMHACIATIMKHSIYFKPGAVWRAPAYNDIKFNKKISVLLKFISLCYIHYKILSSIPIIQSLSYIHVYSTAPVEFCAF